LKKKEVEVETLAGIIIPKLFIRKNSVYKVKVNMGKPKLAPNDVPVLLDGEKIVNREIKLENENIRITCVSMGNPHCVIFVKDVKNTDVKRIGKELENNSLFPNRTNVEFVEVIDKNNIKVRVWERGAGETLSCGTGACASVVAGVLNNLLNRFVNVYLPGGKLEIFYDKDENIFLTGTAETVFEGKIVFE
jgi:diaminopimelate epimerase